METIKVIAGSLVMLCCVWMFVVIVFSFGG